MKRSNALRATFWLATIFAIAFLVRAESGDRRASVPQARSAAPAPIRIVDQNGQPAVSGVPSATSTIFDVTVGPGGTFTFTPNPVNISVGDTVRWTWSSSGHSVTSGLPCAADSQYCSPNDMSCFPGSLSNSGTVYQHTFTRPGTYSYFCLAHCSFGMTGVVNVAGGCAPTGWSAGPNLPSVLVRSVGVYFPADGNFYSVGGSFATGTTATPRVFSYNPVTDTSTVLTGDDWPGAMGTILPGGFTVFNNKLYILGGFNISVASTNQIWQFDPTAAVGAKWLQRTNTPVGIMYAPTCTINGIIYVGGASDFQGGLVVDTTNSFSFNPVANTIGMIAAIPRATGETRGLTFNGKMLVMGGGRVAPNPSNEVDAYDPVTNMWTVNTPVPAFVTGRRNFPTDTDGTTRIWLAGGYDSTGVPINSMEIFCNGGGASPTPTPTPTSTATATATATPTATGASPTVTPTPTATATATAAVTATPSGSPASPTPTATPTGTPGGRTTPTPRPRPTPIPRP